MYFRADGGLIMRSLTTTGKATLYLLGAGRNVTGSEPDPVTGSTNVLVAYQQ